MDVPQDISLDTQPVPGQVVREFVRLFLFHQRRVAHEQGLPPKARMLMLLCRYEPLTQSEFGRLLGLEKSWVSRGVEHLVEEGWVERKTLASDRRSVLLTVTPKGREQAQQLEACFNTHAQAIFSQIPPARQALIVEGLQDMIAILAKQGPDVSVQAERDAR
jgi:DNA-binding MarR family transcriptional regulator